MRHLPRFMRPMTRILTTSTGLFLAAAIFAVGCSDGIQTSNVFGPGNEESTPTVAPAGKAVLPDPNAPVSIRVIQVGGEPAPGLEVAVARSISGRALDFRWTGTTDDDGVVGLTVDSNSGYYIVRASNPATGETVDTWGSVPLNRGRENILTLEIGGGATIHPQGPMITVATWNLYLGADIGVVLNAPENLPLPVAVSQMWGTIMQNDFNERAMAIADQIARQRPHLVGLQECSLYRIQSPGDFLSGNPQQASEVVYDYLEILLDELARRGLSYRAVAVSEGIDIELPSFTGLTTPMDDVRLTDREVILARSGVAVEDVVEAVFQAGTPITVGGIPFTIPRAWAAVTATVSGRQVRFASTHLATQAAEPIQVFQAQELLATLATETLPVILVGDFNSAADGVSTPTYPMVLDAGYTDLWDLLFTNAPGYTASQDKDLLNEESALDSRIDFIFSRDVDLVALRATTLGDEERDRTDSGKWPSDHAGIAATLRLPAARPF